METCSRQCRREAASQKAFVLFRLDFRTSEGLSMPPENLQLRILKRSQQMWRHKPLSTAVSSRIYVRLTEMLSF